jgi:WXG100 family type VII secretion target
MANRLTIDFDALNETITAYQSTIDDLNQAVAAIDVAMGNLRATKWSTEASAEYFIQYSDSWRLSVRNHITALEKIKSGLETAEREYSRLYDRIPDLIE